MCFFNENSFQQIFLGQNFGFVILDPTRTQRIFFTWSLGVLLMTSPSKDIMKLPTFGLGPTLQGTNMYLTLGKQNHCQAYLVWGSVIVPMRVSFVEILTKDWLWIFSQSLRRD